VREGVHAIAGVPGKLAPAHTLELTLERKIMPSDLDVNNHVNNAEYVRWIADCVACSGRAGVSSLQVNYLDEALLGDTVELRSGHGGGAILRIDGVSRTSGSTLFQAEVGFEEPSVAGE
jgi:acyl-CoA thioesterase FadM